MANSKGSFSLRSLCSRAAAGATVTLLLCSLCAAGPPSRWSPTGALVFPRHGHTATRLADGSVFVAGPFIAATERYDPSTETWKLTEQCLDNLLDQSATLLLDGRVLVAGGGEGNLKVTQLYDPETDRWSVSGKLSRGRYGHTSTRLADGRVLVAGGYVRNNGRTRFSATAEVYDPATGRWRRTGALKTERVLHTATLLADGRVLVVGGASNSATQASAEIYDPATGRWSETGSMAEPRIHHTLTVLEDSRVLVVGGAPFPGLTSGAELYDPVSGQWTPAAPLSGVRNSHTATLLLDGRVLVAGGIGEGDHPGGTAPIATAEIYDPATDTWAPTDPLSVPRVEHSATLLADGRVLVEGGLGPGAGATAEIFDPRD